MKDDKFIMINLDDKRSKKIAEVLGNKTCKKIIDHLSEIKDASEKDMADALNVPINTVEYNLKKLLDVGLVEKTKNFFWSSRGKRIPMYKIAKKHIVISPKSKPSLNSLKIILPVIFAAIAVFALIALVVFGNNGNGYVPGEDSSLELKQFNSLSELKDFLKENQIENRNHVIMEMGGVFKGATTSSVQPDTASDYSETNIQVEGVDEADVVKNDGKYIYVVSKNKVVILNAYPAEDMEILSEIEFENNVEQIFINEDKLVVLGSEYSSFDGGTSRCMASRCMPPSQESKSVVYIYDVEDREYPELEEKILVSGRKIGSRMIGDYVYLITNENVQKDGILPMVESNSGIKVIDAEEIYYRDVEDIRFQYTIISAINIENGRTSVETMLTGSSQTIYVSQNNIYTTQTTYPKGRTFEEDIKLERTIIQKISIDEDNIKFVAEGEVPGHILNQFSMDEYENNFRIATTVGQVWNSEELSENNVYVLDKDLEVVGELEGLAPGEKIYSVRFMGEKGYVVTFKKVDPLFVIDLSDPENPEVLGKLKIPGYSDYLHPYDENHVIGIGKDTVEADEELKEGRGLDFVWYQGVKMAIFDVSDVENPIELYKVVIGDRGTNSFALQDHKAFLFDRERELLVLPISLAEIQGEKTEDNERGDYVFQGAYIYKINLEDGFDLRGRITHYDEDEVEDKSGHYWRGNKDVTRSLYMDDALYTISESMIKANDLDDLDEINYVEF